MLIRFDPVPGYKQMVDETSPIIEDSEVRFCWLRVWRPCPMSVFAKELPNDTADFLDVKALSVLHSLQVGVR